MTWPDGLSGPLHLLGRARDLHTRPDGSTASIAESQLRCVTGFADRQISSISSEPVQVGLERLLGARGGGNLRKAIAAELPELIELGCPLHLLLDDLAGSTLIAGFAVMRWRDALPGLAKAMEGRGHRSMLGICSGFRPGASSLLEDGTQSSLAQNVAVVPPLADPDDPIGWHQLDEHPPMAMRRARRIDVWHEDGELRIDAMFRDSCWDPDGTEVAVHEYQVLAAVDRSGSLTSVEATPRVLPYAECPGAAPNAPWLIGAPVRKLRQIVLDTLKGTDCCTHLNDALRSLAEAPILAELL
ncbi:MAG: DUF2889 domain-containing protein [Acidobacteriota bacterium]|nr:DUF2889 domain-containing protein [Acidobacteriota bacterium]